MFQRTAHIVADSYSSRPLLLSLWMSAGPSEPEWPEGSTGFPAQRQFLRIFVSKSRFSQNLKKSWIHICLIYHLVYPQKTTTNFMANWRPYCKILFSNVCPTEKCTKRSTSVPQKNVPSTVVYYYCAWYVFLWYRRWLVSSMPFRFPFHLPAIP